MDALLKARSMLAADLPDVDDGLLTRYALRVFSAGAAVDTQMVYREWRVHHNQTSLGPGQQPTAARGEVQRHRLLIAKTARALGHLGAEGWFAPGRRYWHPKNGLFDVHHVNVPPSGALTAQIAAAAFGWRHIEHEEPLAHGDPFGVSTWQSLTEPYWASDFDGWQLAQQTPVPTACEADHG